MDVSSPWRGGSSHVDLKVEVEHSFSFFQNLFSFFLKERPIYFMCMTTCLYVCLCTMYVPSTHGGPRSLRLELHMVISNHVGVGN